MDMRSISTLSVDSLQHFAIQRYQNFLVPTALKVVEAHRCKTKIPPFLSVLRCQFSNSVYPYNIFLIPSCFYPSVFASRPSNWSLSLRGDSGSKHHLLLIWALITRPRRPAQSYRMISAMIFGCPNISNDLISYVFGPHHFFSSHIFLRLYENNHNIVIHDQI